MPASSPSRDDASPHSSSRSQSSPRMFGESSASSMPAFASDAPNPDSNSGDHPDVMEGQTRSTEQPRRDLHRHSGGFLLESTRGAARGARQTARLNVNLEGGKQKAKRHHTSVPQPRNISESLRDSPGKARSPLSQELGTTHLLEPSALDGSDRQDWPSSSKAVSQDRPKSIDSDSADIVNLALSLNESRRRRFQVSGSYDASPKPKQHLAPSPFLSSSPLMGFGQSSSTKQVRNQLGNYRRDISSHSRYSSADEKDASFSYDTYLQDEAGNLVDATVPDFNHVSLSNSSIVPSEATMQRVQKAKKALELSYQYRRLLQYLPELPSPNPNFKRPATGKAETSKANEPNVVGRRYNPLQYVRNRRARFREGCPLNPEADGWIDIDRVQSWVSSVADQRQDDAAAGKVAHNLPPFPGSDLDHVLLLQNLSSETHDKSMQPKGSKPARPRSDWETTSWGLLADAYWTSKEDNLIVLEDRNGNKLYAQGQRGWTRGAQGNSLDSGPRGAQISSNRTERFVDDYANGKAVPTDMASTSRGRAASRPRESLARTAHYSSSSDRRSKWPRKMLRSPSLSSSEESARGGLHRTQAHRRMGSKDLQERALLERQLRDLQAKETEFASNERGSDVKDHVQQGVASNGLRPSRKVRARDSVDIDERAKTSKNDLLSVRQGDDAQLDGFDSTAPNSPEQPQNVPSITINLTPPQRGKANHQKRKSFPQRSILAEVEKGLQKVQRADIAPSHSSTREDSGQPDSHRGSLQLVRELGQAISPSRGSEEGQSRPFRLHIAPARSNAESKESESRFRGLFRGAKIAELVASPVTKVGDLLWHREEAESGQGSSSSYDSVPQQPEREGGTSKDFQRTSRNDSEGSNQSTAVAQGYHLSNLPVFRSPFAANRPSTPVSKTENISQLESQSQKDQRMTEAQVGQPSPGNSEPWSASHSPSQSIRKERSLDGSRRASTFERRFAVVDPFLDQVDQDGAATSPEHHASATMTNRHWASLDTTHTFEDFDLSRPGAMVTLSQVARLKVVQFSCTIRANEVTRRARKIGSSPSEETQKLQALAGVEPTTVPEMEQQLYGSSLLTRAIDLQLAATKDTATKFSGETVSGLHERIQGLHSQISDDLTQMARSAEKGADELGAQLATDCTLDVKRLNETVELIMRRRRRRMRWLRRAGFAVLEWMVLAAMWCVWLVVVLVQLTRGTARFVFKTVKWLLWL